MPPANPVPPCEKVPAPPVGGPGRPDDDKGMTDPRVRPDPALGLLELYDDALPHVYGYLLARCGDTSLAEDLTAESFLAAVHAARKPGAAEPSVPWLIGVARHKLADHWRRAEREQRGLRLLDSEPAPVRRPVGRRPSTGSGPARRSAGSARTTGPRSRCATWTGSRSPRWPATSTAPCTPPRRCSCGPAPRSAGSTRSRRARDDRSVRGAARARQAGRARPWLRRAAAAAAGP